MAVRYVRIGQHPDYRDEVRGPLAEILASTANEGTYAAPEDVTGTYLEMGADGLWAGASVGNLTQAQADALVSAGAMAKVATGTKATLPTGEVRWGGAGWELSALGRGMFSSYSSLPSVANNGDIAYIPQLIGSELIRMRYVAATGLWVVEPGQAIINAYNIFEVVSAPSTAGIIYSFPLENGLFQPGQTWRIDAMASGVIGAVGAGFRTSIGSAGTNSAKTALTTAAPRARSNKTFSRKPDGKLDFFEFDGISYGATSDAPFLNDPPRVVFEPGQAGDSFLLRTYVLRRIG